MNEIPQTLIEAVRYFSDPRHCFDFMREIKWPGGTIICPTCGNESCTDCIFKSLTRMVRQVIRYPKLGLFTVEAHNSIPSLLAIIERQDTDLSCIDHENCDLSYKAKCYEAEVKMLREKLAEAESHVHYCPKCKMYCKECECAQKEMDKLRDENVRLRAIISRRSHSKSEEKRLLSMGGVDPTVSPIRELQERERVLREAVAAFLEIWPEAEKAIDSCIVMSSIHGADYRGPSLEVVLDCMRSALAGGSSEGTAKN